MSILISGIEEFDFFLDSIRTQDSSADNSPRRNFDSKDSNDGEHHENDSPADLDNFQKKRHLAFAAKVWMGHAPDWIAQVRQKLVPGTYQHFLLLLFESSKDISEMQADMQYYLQRNYLRQLKRAYKIPKEESLDCFERELLASEFQTLRDVFTSIRASADEDAVLGINQAGETGEDDNTSQASKEASGIIARFKSDIQDGDSRESKLHAAFLVSSFQKAKNCLGCLSPDLPFEDSRSVSTSLRLARLDVCNFSNDSHKTFASSEEASAASQAVSNQLSIKGFLVSTAYWLYKVKGTNALDLFCDLAKVFTSQPRKRIPSDGELWHLHLLSTLYPSKSTSQHISDPWIGYDPEMSNTQYFRDCEASQRTLMESVRARAVSKSIGILRQGFRFNSDSHEPTTEPQGSMDASGSALQRGSGDTL